MQKNLPQPSPIRPKRARLAPELPTELLAKICGYLTRRDLLKLFAHGGFWARFLSRSPKIWPELFIPEDSVLFPESTGVPLEGYDRLTRSISIRCSTNLPSPSKLLQSLHRLSFKSVSFSRFSFSSIPSVDFAATETLEFLYCTLPEYFILVLVSSCPKLSRLHFYRCHVTPLQRPCPPNLFSERRPKFSFSWIETVYSSHSSKPPPETSVLFKWAVIHHGASLQELSFVSGLLSLPFLALVAKRCPNLTLINISGSAVQPPASGRANLETVLSLFPLLTCLCIGNTKGIGNLGSIIYSMANLTVVDFSCQQGLSDKLLHDFCTLCPNVSHLKLDGCQAVSTRGLLLSIEKVAKSLRTLDISHMLVSLEEVFSFISGMSLANLIAKAAPHLTSTSLLSFVERRLELGLPLSTLDLSNGTCNHVSPDVLSLCKRLLPKYCHFST